MNAHAEYMLARRRVHFRLNDLARASRMPPMGAWLFLHRHTIGFVARWLVLGAMLSVTPWAWVAIIGIPLVGLLRTVRERHAV